MAMLPYVVVHNAVSADGRMDRLEVDMEQYYSLVSTWKEDLTLCGSETMLRAPLDGWGNDGTCDPSAPLLAVADSRGRFRSWNKVVPSTFWRRGIALCSGATPRAYLEYLRKAGIEAIVTGEERVDLREALERLAADHGVRVVRVDSGGTLNGALLRAGLVSEVSMVVHPQLTGGTSPASMFRTPDLKEGEATPLELISSRKLKRGLVWLRYRVLSTPAGDR
ncbi:MAG: RibD family protein [Methanomassiliicoccus sp.]|nr:RibD family protein [Methanomassiliicoccus sp.]